MESGIPYTILRQEIFMNDTIVEVDALLERMYKIKDTGLVDRGSMNAAGRMVLCYHAMGVEGSR